MLAVHLLCADCAYFERTLNGGELPPLGFDSDQQRDSIKRLQALGAAGARLIPGDDAEVLGEVSGALT